MKVLHSSPREHARMRKEPVETRPSRSASAHLRVQQAFSTWNTNFHKRKCSERSYFCSPINGGNVFLGDNGGTTVHQDMGQGQGHVEDATSGNFIQSCGKLLCVLCFVGQPQGGFMLRFAFCGNSHSPHISCVKY